MALSNAQICQLLESNFCSTLFIHSMQTITVFKVFFLIHQLNPSSDILQAQRGLNLISISLVAPSLDRRPPHPPWVDLGTSTNFLWNIHTFLARNQTWDQLGFFPEKKLLAICTGLVLHSHLQVLMGSMSHSSMGLSTTTVCTLSLHCTGPCDFSFLKVFSFTPISANPPQRCYSFGGRRAVLESWCRRCPGCTSSPAASPRCTPLLATAQCVQFWGGEENSHLVTLEAGGVSFLYLSTLLLLHSFTPELWCIGGF